MKELERVESAMEDYKKWSANAFRAECRMLRTAPASSNKSSFLAALRASLLVTEGVTASGVMQSPFHRSKLERKTRRLQRLGCAITSKHDGLPLAMNSLQTADEEAELI
ncbi:uncharacterized protein PITG_01196 [Phytophthora infestans T30-4]|uniref:Uncharacterized protein n=1 Tax=Phytophthora infestans (strain T30-4) TaxID=403677 RepID=D0MUV9_PHYIT|nr:uncharacterized protein PITG_01196 [Phytophthora infestans T30-4]EEY60955.1 hypothetical protein PITG_01196 [Phytophthora infestans T30-4]|eukprot:XP_002907872.1 hypothetical protein PITG_01196 [Phytophthora infestans T30-4]